MMACGYIWIHMDAYGGIWMHADICIWIHGYIWIHMDTYEYIYMWGPRSQALAQNWGRAQLGQGPMVPWALALGQGPGTLRPVLGQDLAPGSQYVSILCIHMCCSAVLHGIRIFCCKCIRWLGDQLTVLRGS